MVELSTKEKYLLCTTLGSYLPKLRELLHLSQTDFGERCGISKPRLSVIENGHRIMSWTQFSAVVLMCMFNRKAREYLCRNKIITTALLQYFQQCDSTISPDYNIGIDMETLINSHSIKDACEKDEYMLMIEREQILNTTSKDTLFDYEVETDIFRYSYTDIDGKLHSNVLEHYIHDARYKESVHPDFVGAYEKIVKAFLKKSDSGTLEYMTSLSYKDYQWNRLIYKSIADASGKVSHVYGQIENLHELLTEKSDAEIRASLDLITGTLNKTTAQKEIEMILDNEVVDRVAFLMIDIDNLKHINDSKGHIWGDKSLKQFAKLLQRVFSAEDIIGRFGGDEFVVFMKDIPLAVVTSKIEVFRKHLTELNGDVLTCSIGAVYITSATNKSFEEIFKLADSAMYDVKKSGKNGFMINEI